MDDKTYRSEWEWHYDPFTDEIQLRLIVPRSVAELEREQLVDGLGNDAYFALQSALKEAA